MGIANTGRAPPAGARVGHWVAFCDSGNERCFSDPLGRIGKPQRAELVAMYPDSRWSDEEQGVDDILFGMGKRTDFTPYDLLQ